MSVSFVLLKGMVKKIYFIFLSLSVWCGQTQECVIDEDDCPAIQNIHWFGDSFDCSTPIYTQTEECPPFAGSSSSFFLYQSYS